MLRLAAFLITLMFASSAFGAGLTGTWRATVLKRGNERDKLSDYALTLVFNEKDKTWKATTEKPSSTVEGTYEQTNDGYLNLKSGDSAHMLRVIVNGNTLVIVPKEKPELRFVALRVK